MTSPVVGDAAVAAGGQKEHLVLKRVRAQRPAVAEDHRLPCPPVVIVDLRPVLRRNRAHRFSRKLVKLGKQTGLNVFTKIGAYVKKSNDNSGTIRPRPVIIPL